MQELETSKAKDTDLKALKSRVDNLVANPGTSTEGNTELIDIRVGVDGISYPNAGDAVRTQVDYLASGLLLRLLPSQEVYGTTQEYNYFDLPAKLGYMPAGTKPDITLTQHRFIQMSTYGIKSLTIKPTDRIPDASVPYAVLVTSAGVAKVIISGQITAETTYNLSPSDTGIIYLNHFDYKRTDIENYVSTCKVTYHSEKDLKNYLDPSDFSGLLEQSGVPELVTSSELFKVSALTNNKILPGTTLAGKTTKVELSSFAIYAQNKWIGNSPNSLNAGSRHQVMIAPADGLASISFTQSNSDQVFVHYGIICDSQGNLLFNIVKPSTEQITYTFDPMPSGSVLYFNWFESMPGSDLHLGFVNELTLTFADVVDYNKSKLTQLVQQLVPTVSATYYNYVRKPFEFNGKTAVFVGDSITKGFTSGSSTTTENYPKLLSEKLGLSHTNLAVGGALFTDGKNEVTTIVEQVTNNPNKSADYLFIAGGVNDWQLGVSLEEFTNVISDLCDYLNDNYSSQIIFITPINEAGWRQDQVVATLQEYRNVLTRVVISKDINARFSVVQGNTFNFPTSTDEVSYIAAMFGDKLHPTELGYKTLYTTGLLNALI